MYDPNVEIWKDIPGYEGLYQLSTFGRLKSFHFKTEKIIEPQPTPSSRYCRIMLVKDGARKYYELQRLMGLMFLPVPQELLDQGYTKETLVINHIDENPANNHIENLEWCTPQHNVEYSKGRRVAVYDLQGKLVGVYPSAKAASIILNLDPTSITRCCQEIYNTTKGYICKYLAKDSEPSPTIDVSNKNTDTNKTPIVQFDIDGKRIAQFDSIRQAAELLNIDKTNLSDVVNGRYATYKGYIWRKLSEVGDTETIEVDNTIDKRISVFDLAGNYIGTYSGAKEASQAFDIAANRITECAKGRRNTVKGYIFKYYRPEHVEGYSLNTLIDQRYTGKVSQFDKDGNFLKVWDSAKEAAEAYDTRTCRIMRCVRGDRSSESGYMWRPYEEGHKEGYNLYHIDMNEAYYRPVVQIDIASKAIIQTYPSPIDAFRTAFKYCGNTNGWQKIYYCCKGISASAYAYKWEFVK